MAKINNVSTPKSSFMSVQKDTSIILDCMALKDQNLIIPLDVDINYGTSWKEG